MSNFIDIDGVVPEILRYTYTHTHTHIH
ncbi:hypothetical protein TSAR_010213, partial [Trichomalopsis sarcophagae]